MCYCVYSCLQRWISRVRYFRSVISHQVIPTAYWQSATSFELASVLASSFAWTFIFIAHVSCSTATWNKIASTTFLHLYVFIKLLTSNSLVMAVWFLKCFSDILSKLFKIYSHPFITAPIGSKIVFLQANLMCQVVLLFPQYFGAGGWVIGRAPGL